MFLQGGDLPGDAHQVEEVRLRQMARDVHPLLLAVEGLLFQACTPGEALDALGHFTSELALGDAGGRGQVWDGDL